MSSALEIGHPNTLPIFSTVVNALLFNHPSFEAIQLNEKKFFP